jgi:5'-methylthioadenosine phosphorylase
VGARLAVVGGHSILGSGFGADGRPTEHRDPTGGVVTLLDRGTHVVLQRHGVDTYVPAPRVDHAANVRALMDAGCDRVLAVSSVGGLRAELGVGTFVAPDDFIALAGTPAVHDDARGHVVPAFDGEWRTAVLAAARDRGHTDVRDGGVYWQSPGPRFETPAEIGLIARFADVVGMTAASECVAAQELGLRYAVLCVVDNLANGVGVHPLTPEEFEAGKRATRATVLAFLDDVVPALT